MGLNKSAVVTGASRGIGRAISEELALMGYDLIMVAKDPRRLKTAANALSKKYKTQIEGFACDISKTSDIEQLSQFCVEKHMTPSLLVNNAGIYEPCAITDPIERYDKIMAVNARGMICLTQKLIPLMRKTGKARIVIISSTWAQDSYPADDNVEGAAYATSKWAIRGWARSLRAEVRKYGMGVTVIYPGAVITDEWEGTELPHEVFIQPSDIGRIVGTIVSMSANAGIEEVVIRPLSGDLRE